MSEPWIPCKNELPPEGEVVETKIDDGTAARNEQPLKRRRVVWFLPDGSMYVYYTPTHWRRIVSSEPPGPAVPISADRD